MVKFINCSYPSIKYGRDEIINPIVNIDLVTHIVKGTHAYYPDNVGLATIEFHFSDKNFIRWVFPQTMKTIFDPKDKRIKSVLVTQERDNEYNLLIEVFKAY